MASKKIRKGKHLSATLVTEKRAPCAFCNRIEDDEITYGKQYAIGDIQCHYFCALLSCCLIQKGKDNEGLFGFLYDDILAEIERSKKHKCSHCREGGATLGCSVRECRRQFHLPCGRDRGAVSLFYGTYKSFCRDHAPKQRIPDHIMVNVRARQKCARERSKRASLMDGSSVHTEPAECVCVICYETVGGFPSVETFWPPCCARDAWFHRSCLQRMALTAGLHYLKCPLCNDKDQFYDAVVSQGYYVPDRDAAWELEQNAFAEIYERPLACSALNCLCPSGREHDDDKGPWDIKLCILCGTTGIHVECHTKCDDKQSEHSESRNDSESRDNSDNNAGDINGSADNAVTTNYSQSNTRRSRSTSSSERNIDSLDSITSQNNNESNNKSVSENNRCDSTDKSELGDNNNSQINTELSENCDTRSDNVTENNRDFGKSEAEEISGCQRNNESEDNSDSQQKSESGDTSDSRNGSEFSENSDVSDRRAITRFVCTVCQPAAPKDLDSLAATLDKLIEVEQNRQRERSRSGPVMPSRMSLRRTKPQREMPSTSRNNVLPRKESIAEGTVHNTTISRTELNLKTPKRLSKISENEEIDSKSKRSSAILNSSAILKTIDNKLMSPIKVLEDSLYEKIKHMGVSETEVHLQNVIERVRDKFKKPRPLREKKRIINEILENLFNNSKEAPKTKDPLREWSSPKKTCIEGRKSEENLFEGIVLKKLKVDEIVTGANMSEEQIIIDDKTEKNGVNEVKDENNYDTDERFNDRDNTETRTNINETSFSETSKLKTIDIEKDSSLEISENDDVINIDVLKINTTDVKNSDLMDFDAKSPPVTEKHSIKFNPVNKEILKRNNNIEVDIESFKSHYLNEIDKNKSIAADKNLLSKVNVDEMVNVNISDVKNAEQDKNNIISDNNSKLENLNENLNIKDTINRVEHKNENKNTTNEKENPKSRNDKRKSLSLKVRSDSRNKTDDKENKTASIDQKVLGIVSFQDENKEVSNCKRDSCSSKENNVDLNNKVNDRKELDEKHKESNKDNETKIAKRKRHRSNRGRHSKRSRGEKSATDKKSKHSSSKRAYKNDKERSKKEKHRSHNRKNEDLKEISKTKEERRKYLKRKLKTDHEVPNKKVRLRKHEKDGKGQLRIVLKYKKGDPKKMDSKRSKKEHERKEENKEGTSDSKIKEHNTSRQNIKFKIRFREERLHYSKKQKSNVEKVPIEGHGETKNFKQCILTFNPDVTSFISKPEVDVIPLKRKYVKQEKSPDCLKQTSIASFFKIKAAET